MSIGVVILAGGEGKRMQSPLPKQYLLLDEKPIVCHSVETFLAHPAIKQCIVVCASAFRSYFSRYSLDFAEPGNRRQDSLDNGLQLVTTPWVCVHDAARPFITEDMISRLIESGQETGAAALAVPIKFTIKESDTNGYVQRTLTRSQLWEIQTPQILKKDILEEGFAYAKTHHITVTDDVSLAELIGCRVKLVPGSYQNIKITTPEDLCQNISSLYPTMAPNT